MRDIVGANVGDTRDVGPRVALIALLLLHVACDGLTSPTRSMAGGWWVQLGHSNGFGFSIQQDGERLTGTACSTESGFMMYSNVPVAGSYPRLSFVVGPGQVGPLGSAFIGASFSGSFEERSDTIVGRYRGVDVRLSRTNPSGC